MDDLIRAVFSGFLGPLVAHRLSRYKYRCIFLGTTLVGILVPVGLGCLAVVAVFFASLNSHKNKDG
jgi:hypothetical protein